MVHPKALSFELDIMFSWNFVESLIKMYPAKLTIDEHENDWF